MLLDKIRTKKAYVGVIGLGYVGLPLILAFGRAGFRVLGLDVDKSKIDLLSQGKSYIKHIPSEAIQTLLEAGTLEVDTDFSRVHDLDCILICVPTPLNANREPEMGFIVSTARQIAPYLSKERTPLIALESTTYPGTTREVLVPALEACAESFGLQEAPGERLPRGPGRGRGLREGRDFYAVYSPEREDPNNPDFKTRDIPKVIGADSDAALDLAQALYGAIVDTTVPLSSTRTAEATKLMENIFRSVNIALVNELKVIFDRMGIDVWEVIAAASTKPFGYMPFYPGPGLGGHCIPIDPFYLTWKAREYGITTRFIELAGEINVQMPDYVIQKLFISLNERGKSIKGSRILILGLAYKKNVDDSRESPSFKIMDRLNRYGAQVDYNDPFISEIGTKRDYPQFVHLKGVSLDHLERYDAVVICTHHSGYDYEAIVQQASLVIDTRNACGHLMARYPGKIVKA